MPISNNNEITVRAKYKFQQLDEELKKRGFNEINKYSFSDIFLVPNETDIKNEPVREILKRAILLREAIGITSNKNSKKITFKQKNINDNGEILSQSSAKCSIDSIEDAQNLFKAIGYKKIMKIDEIHSSYHKDNFKIIVKENINTGNVLIEAETNEYYKNIEELKIKISEIANLVDTTDFFVKKAEQELQKIKDLGILKMEELWDVYDKYKRKIGKIIKRNSSQRLQKGEFHLVATGVIVNSNKEILISKRNQKKKLYPNLWECNGGSVIHGENSLLAAIREIQEEIGIELKISEGIFLGTVQQNDYFRDVWKFVKNIEFQAKHNSNAGFCGIMVITR